MKKTALLLLFFLLINNTLLSQQKKKDFEISMFFITINHMTSEAVEAVNKVEDKEKKIYKIGKEASQADFDKVCQEFSWIRKLTLSMLNKQVTNISAITFLDSLTVFKAVHRKASKDNPIDLQPFSKLSALTQLDFKGTYVKNTKALGKLKKLKQVNFKSSNLPSISFLCNSPNLQYLYLEGSAHTFKNYEPIACLKKLMGLRINENKQATDKGLSVLKTLTNLQRVRMANNNNVTSLSFLENSHNIHYLDASGCSNLSDFSALSNLRNLYTVNLGGTQIDNIELLSGIPTLMTIYIADTKVKDISILADCEKLQYVDISKTLVKDVSPLYSCKRLDIVKMSSNIPDIERVIEKLKENNPKVKIKIID